MSTSRWNQIETIFWAALDRDAAERTAFLDAACAGDADLRREVEGMLAAHETSHGLQIEQHLLGDDSPAPPADDALLGSRVGPYRLVQVLGRGGMGTVYLAERADGAFEQQVALKLVRTGWHSDEVVLRFRVERQILARLDHPHIARLLDGGMADDGRPYFALEYVDGEPITAFCDRHRLPVDERLRLFQTVCHAVQFAHRNLVVHRDLKPSNILVTADGTVKLLDFGIAKLLDPDTAGVTVAQTGADVRIMTPEYAAPEQVRGEAITTATDVYALGVLLYELLTGHRPYQLPSHVRAEVERIICEAEPTRPSTVIASVTEIHRADGTTETVTPERIGAARKIPPTRLRRLLRGDLDTIILMALRKEPERRYTSAEQLADDLRRHLDGLPITARPDAVGYRMRKFVQRHRWGVAAAIAFVLLLAGYAATVTVQSQRLAAERDAKTAALAQSEAVTQYLKQLFLATTPHVARGDTLTAFDLLDRGVERVDQLADDPALQIRLLQTFGSVFYQLGDMDRAEPPLQQALALWDSLPNPTADQAGYLLHPLGLIRSRQGHLTEADSLLQRAFALREQFSSDTTTAMVLNALADNANRLDRLEDAERYVREAIALRTPITGPDDGLVLSYLNGLGGYQFRQGKIDSARQTLEEVLARQRRSLGPDSPRTVATLGNLALILKTLGDLEAAEGMYEEAIAQERKLFPEHHPDRAPAIYNLAKLRISKGDPEGSLPLFDEAITIYANAFAPDHWRIRFFEVAKAEPLFLLERYEEAEDLLLRSHADLIAALGPDAEAVQQARQNLVRLYEAWGRPEQAEPYR